MEYKPDCLTKGSAAYIVSNSPETPMGYSTMNSVYLQQNIYRKHYKLWQTLTKYTWAAVTDIQSFNSHYPFPSALTGLEHTKVWAVLQGRYAEQQLELFEGHLPEPEI